MIRVLEETHAKLDVLPISVYDAIAHLNNDKKDIIELLKIDPGY